MFLLEKEERGFLLKAWSSWITSSSEEVQLHQGQLLFFPTNYKADSTFHQFAPLGNVDCIEDLTVETGGGGSCSVPKFCSDVSPWSPCWPQPWASCWFHRLCVSPQVLPKFWNLPSAQDALPSFWDRTLCCLSIANLDTHPHLSSMLSPVEKPATTRTHAMESGQWVSWHGVSLESLCEFNIFNYRREKERKKNNKWAHFSLGFSRGKSFFSAPQSPLHSRKKTHVYHVLRSGEWLWS